MELIKARKAEDYIRLRLTRPLEPYTLLWYVHYGLNPEE